MEGARAWPLRAFERPAWIERRGSSFRVAVSPFPRGNGRGFLLRPEGARALPRCDAAACEEDAPFWTHVPIEVRCAPVGLDAPFGSRRAESPAKSWFSRGRSSHRSSHDPLPTSRCERLARCRGAVVERGRLLSDLTVFLRDAGGWAVPARLLLCRRPVRGGGRRLRRRRGRLPGRVRAPRGKPASLRAMWPRLRSE